MSRDSFVLFGDIVATPGPPPSGPLECHVLFEWPKKTSSYTRVCALSDKITCDIQGGQERAKSVMHY